MFRMMLTTVSLSVPKDNTGLDATAAAPATSEEGAFGQIHSRPVSKLAKHIEIPNFDIAQCQATSESQSQR